VPPPLGRAIRKPVSYTMEVSMSQPALPLLVRLRSSLRRDEVVRVIRERMPEFRAIESLQQK
jgi:hypothetical protein